MIEILHLEQVREAPSLAAFDREWNTLLDEVCRHMVSIHALASVKEFKVAGLDRLTLKIDLSCQRMHVISALAHANFGERLGVPRRS